MTRASDAPKPVCMSDGADNRGPSRPRDQAPRRPKGPARKGARPARAKTAPKPKAPARPTYKPPEEGLWLYGIHAVEAALGNPAREKTRLVASRNAARQLEDLNPTLKPEILDPDAVGALVPPGAVHQGLALLTAHLPEPDLEDAVFPADPGRPVVLLDQVTDPQNVGAVLRSTAALGGRAVVTTQRHAPPVTGALAKAATGAVEHVPYVRTQNLARAIEALKEGGYRIVGLAEEGAEPLTAYADAAPIALALGAEGKGLRALTRSACDRLVHLPTAGPISSLNVSNAAAIALYHVAVTQARRAQAKH